MLDGMQQLLTGDTFEFDPVYLAKLYTCFDKIDPKLKEAQVNSEKSNCEDIVGHDF